MKTFNITVNGTAYNVTVEETAGGALPRLLPQLRPRSCPGPGCRSCACRRPLLLRPLRLPPQAAPALSPLRLRCPATFWT